MTLRLKHGVFETELPDIAAVKAALSAGKISAADELWDPVEERWRPVAEFLPAPPPSLDDNRQKTLIFAGAILVVLAIVGAVALLLAKASRTVDAVKRVDCGRLEERLAECATNIETALGREVGTLPAGIIAAITRQTLDEASNRCRESRGHLPDAIALNVCLETRSCQDLAICGAVLSMLHGQEGSQRNAGSSRGAIQIPVSAVDLAAVLGGHAWCIDPGGLLTLDIGGTAAYLMTEGPSAGSHLSGRWSAADSRMAITVEDAATGVPTTMTSQFRAVEVRDGSVVVLPNPGDRASFELRLCDERATHVPIGPEADCAKLGSMLSDCRQGLVTITEPNADGQLMDGTAGMALLLFVQDFDRSQCVAEGGPDPASRSCIGSDACTTFVECMRTVAAGLPASTALAAEYPSPVTTLGSESLPEGPPVAPVDAGAALPPINEVPGLAEPDGGARETSRPGRASARTGDSDSDSQGSFGHPLTDEEIRERGRQNIQPTSAEAVPADGQCYQGVEGARRAVSSCWSSLCWVGSGGAFERQQSCGEKPTRARDGRCYIRDSDGYTETPDDLGCSGPDCYVGQAGEFVQRMHCPVPADTSTTECCLEWSGGACRTVQRCDGGACWQDRCGGSSCYSYDSCPGVQLR